MIKSSKLKYMFFGVALTIVALFTVIGVSYTLHLLPNTTNASSEHTYHANMITRTFTQQPQDESTMERHADNWVDHIKKLGNYRVETTFSYSQPSNTAGTEKEHVVLIKRYETPFQKKLVRYLKAKSN